MEIGFLYFAKPAGFGKRRFLATCPAIRDKIRA
jgi:hypothetical protein